MTIKSYRTQTIKWLLPALSILALSCTKTITIKTPPYQPEIVIYSVLDVNDQITAQVTQSVSVKNDTGQSLALLQGATVSLYTNGVFTETLHDLGYGEYASSITAAPGNQYTLKVSAPSFTDAEATAIIPAAVSITGINTIYNARFDAMSGNQQDELQITFTDPPSPNDYYVIQMFSANATGFCVSSTDASIETIDDGALDLSTCLDNNNIFLRDQLFNGKSKQLTFYVQSGILEPFVGTNNNGGSGGAGSLDTFYTLIELHHVTEDYFRYEKSFLFAQDNNGNPFAEPVNVYTNVKNGYGLFSIDNVDAEEVK